MTKKGNSEEQKRKKGVEYKAEQRPERLKNLTNKRSKKASPGTDSTGPRDKRKEE